MFPSPIGARMGRGQGEGQACQHSETPPQADALAPHPNPLPDIRRGEGRKVRDYAQSSLSLLRCRRSEIASVQAFHRGPQCLRRTCVVNHIIRKRQPLPARRLHSQNSQRRIAGDTVTLHNPGELRFERHVDDQRAIDPGIVFIRFRQQGNDEYAVCVPASGCGSQQRFAHLRMKNTLQPPPLFDIFENTFAHPAPIEFARRREHGVAECNSDFGKRRLSCLYELTRYDICIEDRNAALAECFGNGALAGCDSTGERD